MLFGASAVPDPGKTTNPLKNRVFTGSRGAAREVVGVQQFKQGQRHLLDSGQARLESDDTPRNAIVGCEDGR
jgi:hypothetical protein